MRHEIQSGGSAHGQTAGANAQCGAVFALALAAVLAFSARTSQAELPSRNTAKQSGNVSGAGSRAASQRGQHSPGYLGILFQNLSDEQVSSLHLKGGRGVEVMLVDHDGPAGKAGLREHDVIVRLNGKLIDSADALGRMLREAGVGARVALLVVRGEKQVTVNAQLAYRGDVEREALARMAVPDPPPGEVDPVVSGFADSDSSEPEAPSTSARGRAFLMQMLHNTPFTGLVVEAMEPQLAGFFGSSTGGGLLVQAVAPNSPAAAGGLHAGDVIERADSIAVKSTGEWVRRLRAGKGHEIVLTVLRDKHEQTMTLIPDLKRHSEMEWPAVFGDQLTLA